MTAPFVVHFNPVAFKFGPLQVHWYGLMYLLGFALVAILGEYRRRRGRLPVSRDALGDLFFYGMMGVIVGGRVWYMLFYYAGGPGWIWREPLALFKVWDGGMSFHGGLLGVVLAGWWWSRRHRLHPFDTIDFVAPLVPLGLGLGRLGNFINGELWGKPTNLPWAMIFPGSRDEDLALASGHPDLVQRLQQFDGLPRHPSQLYHVGLEGIALFLILWVFSGRPQQPRGAVSGVFLIGYGAFRFITEFFREPDHGIFGQSYAISMGQWLSLPMILAGVLLLALAYRRKSL